MIEFLSPSVLWGLASLAIPVIIHFLKNLTRRRVYFSTLSFFKEQQKQQLQRLKILQILLLLLRLLFIFLLVSAFAGPVWRSVSSISFADKDVVVLMDNTFSVFRGDPEKKNLNRFTALLEKMMTTANSSTRYTLITADGRLNRNDTLVNSGLLRNRMNDVNYAAGDIYSLLRLVDRKEVITRGRIIVIYSDRQLFSEGDSARTARILESLAQRNTVFFADFAAEKEDNDGIVKISGWRYVTKPAPAIKGTLFRVLEGENEVTFFNGQKRIDQEFLKQGNKLSFKIDMGNRKIIDGVAELSGDMFMEDNQYFWSFDISNPAEIVFAGDTSAMGPIETLTGIKDLRPLLRVMKTGERELYAQVEKGTDWIFYSPVSWNRELFALIKQFIAKGTGIFLIPGSVEQPFIAACRDLLKSDVRMETLDGDEQAGIANSSFTSELRGYGARAYVRRYFPLRRGKPLIPFDNGFYFAGKKGKINYLAAPLNKKNGNLILHPGLPLWFINWFTSQSRSNAFSRRYFCAEDTLIELPSSWSKASKGLLSTPEGKFEIKINKGRMKLKKIYTGLPGHYHLTNEKTEPYRFDVNVNPLEYTESTYPLPEKYTGLDDKGVAQPVFLWKYFIFLALTVLLLETFIRYRFRNFGS